MNGGKYRALETAALFADGLVEEVLVTHCEAGRAGGFTLHNAGPACAVREDAVGVEFGRNGRAGDGERDAIGIARIDNRRGVGVENGHGSAIGTILRRCSVAELVDAGDYAAQLVIRCAGRRKAYLRGVVCLPSGDLPPKVVVLVASRKPRHVCHVERD